MLSIEQVQQCGYPVWKTSSEQPCGKLAVARGCDDRDTYSVCEEHVLSVDLLPLADVLGVAAPPTCYVCGRVIGRRSGSGLCATHRDAVRRGRTPEDIRARWWHRSREEMLDEAIFLVEGGVPFSKLPSRLGYKSVKSFDTVLRRAAKAGDERALRLRQFREAEKVLTHRRWEEAA